MRQRLVEADLTGQVKVDSAGLGPWHVGDSADGRAQIAAAARGYDLSSLRARQVTPADLSNFDELIAMDHGNLAELEHLAADEPSASGQITLLGNFSPRHAGQPVGDPYYGGNDGFEHALDIIEDCVDGLIDTLRQQRASVNKY